MAGNGEPGAVGRPGEPGAPAGKGRGGRGGTGGKGGPRGRRGERGPRDSRRLLITLCVLAGVLLLVVAVMSTMTLVQQRTVDRNQDKIVAAQIDARDLARNARRVVRAGCSSDNETRAAIRTIIRDSEASLRQFQAEGTITEAQLQRGLDQNRESLDLLSPRRCRDAALAIPIPPRRG